MKFAFIMDPLETVKAYKDTTYYIMLAAAERGHEVYYLDQDSLRVDKSVLQATVTHVDVHEDNDRPFTIKDTREVDMSMMDVVLVRTDPPFDRTYFYTTLLLDLLPASTRVINRPSGLRNWNEKLAALYYPDLTPDTLITRSESDIMKFAQKYERVTLKPIDGHGGQGIHFITADSADARARISEVTHDASHWIIAQQYLPEAKAGDKRVLLLDGEPMGAILRVHGAGAELNNLDQGGSANEIDLDDDDLRICAAIKEGLVREGIVFSGIDVIGGKLIEINVTSPTGLQEMSRFAGIPFHHRIIERLEQGDLPL